MEIYQQILQQAIEHHKAGRFDEAEGLYNRLLNRTPFQEDITFLIADLYSRKEFNGLAINLLSNLLQNNPKHSQAWCNLGVAFRKENQYQHAEAAWNRALSIAGDTVEVCSNYAGLYADRAMPEKALEWCERALKLEPQHIAANWQKALALLTLKRWDEGWKQYEFRKKLEAWDSRPSVDVPYWDGSFVNHLYIHGEQGMGDEIMFASAIPLVKARRITIEVNAKVAPLIKATWPGCDVVTDPTPGPYDAKVPIGSLIGLLGMNPKPYLHPRPERVDHYRSELRKLGPGPYIAVTWLGGTKFTRAEDRSLNLSQLKPILDGYTCVSAQYADTNPYIEPERLQAGLRKIDDSCIGGDLHDQAALFKAVDAVVTVQQTAVHVAGAVGARCYAMIGAKPHWRYGVEGQMPWYPSVTLYRNKDKWENVIQQVLEDLCANHPRISEPAKATA